MKKLIALLMACTTITCAFASCGEETEESSANDTSVSESSNAEETTEATTEEETSEEETTEAETTTEDSAETTSSALETPTYEFIEDADKTPFIGKWECEKYIVEGEEVKDLMGLPLYAVFQFDIKEDGTATMAESIYKFNEAQAGAGAEAESEAEAETESQAEGEAESQAEGETESQAEGEEESPAESEAEAETESQIDVQDATTCTWGVIGDNEIVISNSMGVTVRFTLDGDTLVGSTEGANEELYLVRVDEFTPFDMESFMNDFQMEGLEIASGAEEDASVDAESTTTESVEETSEAAEGESAESTSESAE